MQTIILDFEKFKLLLEQAAQGTPPQQAAQGTPPQEPSDGKIRSAIDLKFNFGPGKYKAEDINPTELANLKKNIVEQTLKIFANNRLIGRKLSIELEASTSTTPVSAALAAQLGTKAGKEGNVKLCEARMATLDQIVVSTLAQGLKVDEATVRSKITILKKNMANQGGGPKPEDFQYIKATIIQEGTPSKPKPVGCKYNQLFDGLQGKPENNYVGYGALPEQALTTSMLHGQRFWVAINSLQIPDCIYIKYGDGPGSEFLSPFTGLPSMQGRNFVAELNKLNEDPANGLVAKINAELAKIGSSGTVESLQPNFFTTGKDGKQSINVLPGATQRGSNKFYTKQYTGDVLNSDFIVRVFSPLGQTQFNIVADCGDIK
jgi:hypothetical protein